MLPSTRLAFTKSCRLNFSTSGSSIGNGGQCGKCESDRTASDYCSWYDQPHWHLRGGEVQVLFRLNFYPGRGGVNHTISYLRLVHPVHRACELLHAQRQVLVQVQMQVELLVLLKNKKQNPQYMYMQLDKDI